MSYACADERNASDQGWAGGLAHFISIEVLNCALNAGAGTIPEFGIGIFFSEKQVKHMFTFRPSFLYQGQSASIIAARGNQRILPITAMESGSRKPVR